MSILYRVNFKKAYGTYDSDWTPSEPEWQADRQLHYSCGNQGNPG